MSESSTRPANIILQVGMSARLLAIAEPLNLEPELEAEANALMARFGVPGRAQLHLTHLPEANGEQRSIFQVVIREERAACPGELFNRAVAFACGTNPVPATDSAALVDPLKDASRDQVVVALRQALGAALQRRPALWLTPEVLDEWLALMAPHLDKVALPEKTWFRQVLEPVLDRGRGLTDVPEIARVLADGISREQPPFEISEDLVQKLSTPEILVEMPLDDLQELSLGFEPNEAANFQLMREGLFYELGIVFPTVRLVASESLPPGFFRMRFNQVQTVPRRGLRPGECLVNGSPDQLRAFPVEAHATPNPAHENTASIVEAQHAKKLEDAGFTTWNPTGFLILALSGELRARAGCFVTRATTTAALNRLALACPALVKMVQSRVGPARITQALRLLADEEISTRNLRQVLQALLEADYVVADVAHLIVLDPRLPVPAAPKGCLPESPVFLAAFVRLRLKSYLSHKYTRGAASLPVYILGSTTEEALAQLQDEDLRVRDPLVFARLQERFLKTVDETVAWPLPSPAPVLLTRSDLRHLARIMAAAEFPRLAVVSYGELSPTTNLQSLGRISFE